MNVYFDPHVSLETTLFLVVFFIYQFLGLVAFSLNKDIKAASTAGWIITSVLGFIFASLPRAISFGIMAIAINTMGFESGPVLSVLTATVYFLVYSVFNVIVFSSFIKTIKDDYEKGESILNDFAGRRTFRQIGSIDA